jgi:cysteine desulfurase
VTARAYLDHASTSPLRPEAFEAMLPFLRDPGLAADPGRLHHEGRTVRVAVEDAREQIAALFGARPREVVLTSGGTEAVATAIVGALARGPGTHVVTTAVEHSSVLDTVRRAGPDATVVGVDGFGRFSADAVLAAVRPDTALVTVQLANHEVGTLQPAAVIAAACRERGVLVHVDACAASGHVRVSFAELGADLCSHTAHTFGGPKGVGALLVRRGLRIPPLLLGGSQERARRGGLEDVPAIVGFGAAAAVVRARLDAEAALDRARTSRAADLAAAVVGVTRFGDPTDRLPHLVCIGVDGVEAEPILLALDQRGIAVHSGSSCSSELLEPSPVLTAMGVDAERSLRISTGWSTVDVDIERFGTAFAEAVPALRALRG